MTKLFSLNDLDPDIAELVPAYLESRKAELVTLDDALKSGQYHVIQHLSHNMKGVASSYGLEGLSDLGGSLEQAAEEKNDSKIRELLDEVKSYLNSIIL